MSRFKHDGELPQVSLRDAPGLRMGIVQPRRSRCWRPGSGTGLLLVVALAIAVLIAGMTVGASTIQ